MKYTLDRLGKEWFVRELHQRLGWQIQSAKPFHFESNADRYGWIEGISKKWFYTLFVENGRVKDREGYALKTALREIAIVLNGDMRLTGNQNMIIGNVQESDKISIEEILDRYGVLNNPSNTGLRLHSMACVALNTCGLAFAESERYLPLLMDKLDVIMKSNNLEKQAINIRMTGCPNGCARSSLGEIGFVGRAVGRYNLYLGASHKGDRLNVVYREMLSEEEILNVLEPLIARYASERYPSERFGGYVIRKKIVKA